MRSQLVTALRTFPLLRQASPEAVDRLAARAQRLELTLDQRLWTSGEMPTSLHFLRRGLVEMVRLMPSGAETSLALFGPRECPGLFAALDARPYPADARVLSESAELLTVARDALLAEVDADPALGRALNQVLRHHNAVLREKVDILTAGEVPQRLATLLIVLSERFGDEGDTGELSLPIVLARGVLARLVGARVETVIRVLSKWDKEGFVTTTDNGFTVHDPKRLRSEAGRA